MRDFSRDEAKKSKSLFIRARRIERRDGILSRRMLTRRRSDTGIQRLIGVVPLTRYRFARVLLPFARGRVLLRERERASIRARNRFSFWKKICEEARGNDVGRTFFFSARNRGKERMSERMRFAIKEESKEMGLEEEQEEGKETRSRQ